jgi:hypothetical protein
MEEKKVQKKVVHKLSTTADGRKTWEKFSRNGKKLPVAGKKLPIADRRKIARVRGLLCARRHGTGAMECYINI